MGCRNSVLGTVRESTLTPERKTLRIERRVQHGANAPLGWVYARERMGKPLREQMREEVQTCALPVLMRCSAGIADDAALVSLEVYPMTEARHSEDADRIGNVLSSTMSVELDNEVDQGVLENVLGRRVQVPELLELPGPDQRVREVEAVDNPLNPIHLGVCSICRARPGREVRAGRTVVDCRVQFDGDSDPGSWADGPTRLPCSLSERALADCGVLSGSTPAQIKLAQIHQ